MLVIAQLDVLPTDIKQKVFGRLSVGQAQSDRKCIDEQPDHRSCIAIQRRVPASAAAAENHVLFTRVPSQDQCPCTLNQGAKTSAGTFSALPSKPHNLFIQGAYAFTVPVIRACSTFGFRAR